MRTQIFAVAIALAPLASAIGWPAILPDIDAVMVRRQDEETSATRTTTSPTSAKTEEAEQTTTAKTTTKGPITTDLNTAGNDEETSGTAKTTGTNKSTSKSSKTTATMFDPQDPAGGATMITPAATLGTPLYKVEGTPVTWIWNYTSVQGKPTAVDVLIKCSFATQTITLAQNVSYKNPQSFTWDIHAYEQTAINSRLINDMYTMVVYDADGSPTMTAAAGYLAPFDSFRFGVYHTQAYADLDEWNCATCSAGNGAFDRNVLGFVVWMSILTVFSFTWFVGGFGALI